MSLFVIADLHLPFSNGKTMNFFRGWNNYVDRLYKNWQKKVSPEDTVVMPGDFSWAGRLEETLGDFRFLQKLNGKKIILRGNHDYWWGTMTKMTKYFEDNCISDVTVIHNTCAEYEGGYAICGTRGWVDDNGESETKKIINREAIRLELSITEAEKRNLKPIVFLHYPPVYSYGENEQIMNTLRKHNIKKCFYGHLHGTNAHAAAVTGLYDGIEFYLVSSDFLQFDPLDITKIVQYDD